MAVLTKKLYIKNAAGTQVACNIYSTAAEAGTNYLTVKVDSSTTGYVKLGTTSDSYATSGRVKKGGTTYAICRQKASSFSYKGEITGLSVARIRRLRMGVRNDDYAIFGPGFSQSIYGTDVSVTDAYNKSLTRSTPTSFSPRYEMNLGNNGTYAIFAGGIVEYRTNKVDAYNKSLTYSSSTMSTSETASYYGSARVGNYCLIVNSNGNVDAFNTSLTRSAPTGLSTARYGVYGGNVGGYALFAGGGGRKTVDVYNTSLTRSLASDLVAARVYPVGVTVGGYALFAGGYVGTSATGEKSLQVDVYNTSLTHSSLTLPSGTILKDYGMSTSSFALLIDNSGTKGITYDSSLTYGTCNFPSGKVVVGGVGFDGYILLHVMDEGVFLGSSNQIVAYEVS